MSVNLDPMRRGTAGIRERTHLRPWMVVAIIILFFAALVLVKFVQQPSGAEASEAAFTCPEPPAPFVLVQNEFAQVGGQNVYVACAWVGGVPQGSPLP